jgi:hypothetical protein
MADMREELQEKKASQSASAPRIDMLTPPTYLHWGNDEDYHGVTYSFRGDRLHPIKGGRGRSGGGRGIPMQQYVKEEEGSEAATSSQLEGNSGTIKRKMPEFKGNNNAEEYIE